MFETQQWKQYLNEFNTLGGGYRYRWVDIEIIGLYAYIHLNNPLIDFNLKNDNIYGDKLPGAQIIKNSLI